MLAKSGKLLMEQKPVALPIGIVENEVAWRMNIQGKDK